MFDYNVEWFVDDYVNVVYFVDGFVCIDLVKVLLYVMNMVFV